MNAVRIGIVAIAVCVALRAVPALRANPFPWLSSRYALQSRQCGFLPAFQAELRRESAQPVEAKALSRAWKSLAAMSKAQDDGQRDIPLFHQLRAATDVKLLTALPTEQLTPWVTHPTDQLAAACIAASRQLTADTNHDEAGACLRDGVRMVRLLHQVSANWKQWLMACHAEQNLLREIAEWGADDKVTEAELRTAFVELQDITKSLISPKAMLCNRTSYLGWVLHTDADPQSVELYRTLDSQSRLLATLIHREDIAATIPHRTPEPSELMRCAQIVALCELLTSAQYWPNDDVETHASTVLRDDVVRILLTTDDRGLDLKNEPVLRSEPLRGSPEFQTFVATLTDERATLLILELQAWRRQHGEFPNSLQDLLATEWRQEFHAGRAGFSPVYLHVPVTGDVFGYSGTGLDKPITALAGTADERIIPPQQPLLWSRSSPESMNLTTRKIDWFTPTVSVDGRQGVGTAPADASSQNQLRRLSHAVPGQIHLEWSHTRRHRCLDCGEVDFAD